MTIAVRVGRRAHQSCGQGYRRLRESRLRAGCGEQFGEVASMGLRSFGACVIGEVGGCSDGVEEVDGAGGDGLP